MTEAPSALLKTPFRFYILRHWRLAAAGLISLFLTNALDVAVPWLVGKTLDKILADVSMNVIGGAIGQIFVVIFFLSIFRFFWRYFWARFHHSVAEDLRNRVFAKMSELGPTFFASRKVGQLIALISNDVNSFRMGIGPGLLVIFDGLFLAGMILPMMVSISFKWTWQTLILMPIVPFLVRFILSRIHREYKARQDRFSEMAGSAQEIVSGIRVIKSFGKEEAQLGEFNRHSDNFRGACDRVVKWDGLFGPTLELPVAIGSVFLMLLGAPDVISGAISIGQFFTFYQYIQRMMWPMSAIGIGLGNVQEARAAFARIQDVLESQPDVPDNGHRELSNFESLEVRNLSFQYPGTQHQALQNISFRIERGQRVGIIGVTGSGKSTLVALLTRQYAAPKGTIFVNDIPVEEIRLQSLRRLIAFVPQEAFLFSRRVDENMALGVDDWDLDEVKASADQVRIRQEIESWPEAYASLIGERGVNLSGGQKQRLTLARALMRDAPLVILDDALSAVDAKTEESILNFLGDDLKRTTSIVISHRIASIKDCDQVLVLSSGKMEAGGKPDSLATTSPTYRAIQEMQVHT